MLDLFDARYPTEVAAIRMLLFSGARRDEIETLEWHWVKPDRLALPDSKTGPKIVYLNAPAREVLAGLTVQPGTHLVFPDRSLRPLRLDNFWARFRRECALPDVRLHELRHSFASTAIMHGVPLATIGRLLGHALPETTARYAHLADDSIADAAQRVSGSLAARLRFDL
jgi:integrase